MIDTNNVADDTPKSKIYDLQIHSSELYAFEPLICDTIHDFKVKIADARKRLGILSENSDQVKLLSNIERWNGESAILQDLLDQMVEQGL